MKDAADLGQLVTRCDLPAITGMDALEARLITVQEVPPKGELRFFAVRGEVREPLSNSMALDVLRDHAPRTPLGAMTEIELVVEISVLRDDVDHMRPIYEAAKRWRKGCTARFEARFEDPSLNLLRDAIDAAKPENP
jgi:hypothetical protein